MAMQISSAAEEQRAVTEEVGRNIQATKDVTDELSQTARRSNELAADLHEISRDFYSSVSPVAPCIIRSNKRTAQSG